MTYADSDTDRHSSPLPSFLPSALPAVIPAQLEDLWWRVLARFKASVGFDIANSLKSLQFSSIRGTTVFLSIPHIGLRVMADLQKARLLNAWQGELPDIQDVQFVVRSVVTAKGLGKFSRATLPAPEPKTATEPKPAPLSFLPEPLKPQPDQELMLARVLQAWQRVKVQYNLRYLSRGHPYSSCPLKFIGVFDDVVSLEMSDHLRDRADEILGRLLLDCWQEDQPAIQKMLIRRPQGLRVTDMTIMVTSETDIEHTLDKLFENAIYEQTLQNGIGTPQPYRLRIEDIQRIVCKFYGVLRSDMVSNRRTRVIVKPRQVGMYLCKMLTPRSFPEIGRRFGGRDHTTVLHAVRKIELLLLTDLQLAADIRLLTQMIENPDMDYP